MKLGIVGLPNVGKSTLFNAITKAGAEAAAKRLIKIGIRGIWNFAHTDLRVPDDVVVENVHLSESLMRISYRLSNQEE